MGRRSARGWASCRLFRSTADGSRGGATAFWWLDEAAPTTPARVATLRFQTTSTATRSASWQKRYNGTSDLVS